MGNATLSPLAMLVAYGTLEELQTYFSNAKQLEVSLSNELLPKEELDEVCDFLGIEGHPAFGEGEITLHGPGGGISTRERMEIQDYLRRSLDF
jgi:hypothetical protein